jgi:hypothetical protein
MDPELLQLFAAAKSNNKNVSGLLGNMDNSIFAYLAGAYDPLAGGSAGGPLWAQYSSNPDPIIQDIISKIKGGADPFYLNSYIEAIPNVDSTGFQLSDLQGLARGLQKEFAGGGSADEDFTKAGIRSPLDVYSTMDIPLQGKAREDVSKIRSGRAWAEERLGEAKGALAGLKNRQRLEVYEKKKSEKKPGATNQILDWLGEKTGVTYLTDVLGEVGNEVVNTFGGRRQPGYGTQGRQSPKPRETPQIRAMKKAQEVEGLAQQQVNAGAADEEAYRRGVLRAYTEAGRTPTRDQLAAILRFGAGQSNA